MANVIVSECIKYGLDMDKLLGQGYDGCSVMASSQNGVQARIREKYPKAAFVHCASHRLNLVVNDLNDVSDIRNAVGVTKKIVNFFRDSPKRRALLPNLPLLYETRWTEKYKSIRVFSHNFDKIFDCLADTAAGQTGHTAHVLLSACSSCTFLICLFIVANYSSILEPVAQMLQSVQLDIVKALQHISSLINIIKNHRDHAEEHRRDDILSKARPLADKLGIELVLPRICSRQTYRANSAG